MKKIWQHKERAGVGRIEGDLKRLRLPFKKRVDLVWLVLFSSAFFIFILWWLIGVLLGHRFGLFDPPAVRAIDDPRIMVNIRDDIRQYPMLDAAFHAPEKSLYLSQSNGKIHRYSPETGLWNTEKPFSSSLMLLRSGNGSDPASYRFDSCWDNDSLWGLTENNGLVRRLKNKWQIVKGDTVFMGSRGQPVKQGELTSAAVSSDKAWLVVGTSNDGTGIYDLRNRQWLPLDKTILDSLPAQKVSHVVWSLDRFWLGGPKGLASLKVVEGQAHIMAHGNVKGAILDMDVDLEGNTWVLERKDCQSGGNKCLRLSRFRLHRETEASPERLVMDLLMEERNIFPMLNLEDLHFARYWPAYQRLIVAGTAGLYSYDTRLHNWERHYRGAVQAVLPFEDGNTGFYFGFTGGIGLVSEKYQPWTGSSRKCQTWKLPGQNQNEKIMTLHFGLDQEVLAMGMSGKVFRLDAAKVKDNISLVYQAKRTGVNPRNFRKAVSLGDMVLFQASKKAVVHHLKKRTYTDIPLDRLPNWLKQPGLQMKTSADWIYASSVKGGETWVYRLNIKDAEAGDFQKAPSLAVIPGPVREFREWNGQGVALITGPGDGRVFRFESGKEELIGSRVPGSQRARLLDAAEFQNGLAVATLGGILHYDYGKRSWSNYIRITGGSSPQELASAGDTLFMSTSNGRLMELDHSRKFTGLIGGDERFGMTDAQLSDVLIVRDKLYLAGNGWVYRYDPLLRGITVPWKVPGQGRIRLNGIINNQPLSSRGGMAYLGSAALDPRAGKVISIAVNDAFIYTLRQKNNNDVYLKRYDKDDPFSRTSRCFFYTPYSGSDTGRVTDAAELAEDMIAVATAGGLKFYNPVSRSWMQKTELDPLPWGGRIHKMGNEAVFAAETRSGVQLTIMYIDSLRLPSGCANAQVTILQKPKKVNAYTINRKQGELFVIEPDNAVALWHGRNRFEYMPPTADAPRSSGLERVYLREVEDKKFLTLAPESHRQILRYDLIKRSWHDFPLDLSALSRNQSPQDINCQSGGFQEWITLKTSGGEFYSGALDLLIPAAVTPLKGIEMTGVYTPGSGFGHSGKAILDVQASGSGRWTFLLKDRVKYYDPVKRSWSADIVIPSLSGTPVYYRWKKWGVIRSSGGNAWWVGRQQGGHTVSFVKYQPVAGETTALDEEGAVWRLLPDGILYRMEIPESGNSYPNPSVAFETPYIIRPGQIKAAYEWNRRILFETAGGYRIFDTLLRREMELPEAAQDREGIKEILSFGNQLWIRTGSDRLLLISYQTGRDAGLAGRVFPGSVSDLRQRVEDLRDSEFDRSPMLEDKWSQLKSRVVSLPDGRQAFDPIIALEIDANGQLAAKRPGASSPLAAAGVLNTGTLPPALDETWIRWDRRGKGFKLKTSEGEMFVSADGFVKDGKLLFEEVEALLVMDSHRWYAANRHGIWRCTGGGLQLNHPAITFTPLNWTGPVIAAHGGFIAGKQRYEINAGGEWVKSNKLTYSASWGDIVVSEDMLQRRVSGRIKGKIPLFAQRGFAWDQNRRGLGFIDDKVVILSDAGIHPVQGYEGFETLPPGTARGEGRLYYDVKKDSDNIRRKLKEELFFYRDNTWYKRTGPSQWSRASDPRATRNLIDNNTWTWELKKGKLEVRLKSDNHDFKIQRTSRGLVFNSDLPRGASVSNNRLSVVSGAFTETTNSGDRYQVGRAFNASRSSSMDGRQQQNNSNSRRRMVYFPESANDLSAVLRFTRINSSSGGPRVKKELRVSYLRGGEKWLSFDFLYGRFPFDVIYSLAAAKGSDLYIGSGAGLQVYGAPFDLRLRYMKPCIQLGSASSRSLTPVDRVGVPLRDRTVIRAQGGGLCIQKKHAASAFNRCNRSGSFSRLRQVGQTSYWQFVKRGNRLEYAYYDETGKLSSPRSDLMNGRFPHDNLKDIAIDEKGDVFTMWRNGWVARHKDGYLGLQHMDKHEYFNTRRVNAQRFIQSGGLLYFEADNGRLWYFSTDRNNNGSWLEERKRAKINAILTGLRQSYIVNQPRLRMPQSKPFHFQYRDLNGQWKRLKWTDKGLAIDEWSEFLYAGDMLWAATGEGLVRFSRGNPGNPGEPQPIILDPASLIVLPEPRVNGKLLAVTDMENNGDNEEEKVTLRLEGKSGQVFQGVLDGSKDRGVFTNLKEILGKDAGDPFYNRVQVIAGNDFWEWVLDGRTGRKPGRLKARWQGEEVQLVGGRFSFDNINSLAFFKEDIVEIATDSGGWVRSQSADISVPRLVRPKEPGIVAANVKEVRSSINNEGEPVLGLRLAGRSFIRLGKEGVLGQTGAFPQLLADDGFWRYMSDDSGLVIAASKSTGGSGRVTRKIQKGRFTDDIVLGLPAGAAWKNGEFYLVPTKAGILQLNKNLEPVDIYPPGSGNSKGETGVLYIDIDENRQFPFVLADGVFQPVDKDLPGVKPLPSPTVPAGSVVTGIEDGPQDYLRVRWKNSKGRGWWLLNRDGKRVEEINSLYVDLSQFGKYLSQRKKWGDSPPWMRVRLAKQGQVEFLKYGAAQPYVLELPEPANILSAIIDGQRLILVGAHKLWEINLEYPLERWLD